MIRIAIGKELVWFDEFGPDTQTARLKDDNVALGLRLKNGSFRVRTSKHWYKELEINDKTLEKESQYEMEYQN